MVLPRECRLQEPVHPVLPAAAAELLYETPESRRGVQGARVPDRAGGPGIVRILAPLMRVDRRIHDDVIFAGVRAVASMNSGVPLRFHVLRQLQSRAVAAMVSSYRMPTFR